jgi:hypothetical protein
MAQTKYITIAELKESFDSRMLGQLGSYSGTPDALGDESNTVILNSIEKASAEIQSYALRGNRYTADNLDTIKDDDDWTLKGLCATLTVKHLFRGKATQAPADIVQMIEEGKEICEALGSGGQIFNFDQAVSGGEASVVLIPSNTRGQLRLASDQQFFPDRLDRKY